MKDAIEKLQKLGFSRSEALVYVTLLKHGPLSARSLSDLSGVPYSKVYTVLDSLSRKGFVSIIESRPRLYAAVDPEEAIPLYVRKLVEEIESAGKELIKILREISLVRGNVEERRVLLIRDPGIIAAKVADAIDEAKIYVKLSAPDRLVERIKDKLKEAVSRGVKVYVISPKDPGVPKVLWKPMNVMGGGIIVDGRIVVILLKDLNSFIAVYSDHPSLAVLAETYYDFLRNQGTP